MSERECGFAHDDAAYVLGALGPNERLAFERHLPTCPDCARAVRDLAGMPGLLARVPVEVAQAPGDVEPLPDTLLPRLLADVRRSRARRRWTVGLAAAAAVLVAAGVGATVVRSAEDGPTPTAAARTMTPLDQGRVGARVALTSVAWGTRLDLTCSYDAVRTAYGHDEPAPTYALVVRTRAGVVERVATWHALPGRTMRLTGATAVDVGDIAAVEVLTADGHPVLRLRS